MTTTPPVIKAVDNSGCGLQVVFDWHGDRHSHRIQYVQSDLALDLLHSVEGVGSESWPASPPLQQLSIESRPTGDVGLLLGMAGKSHWSASIEADHVHQRLVFDIACRTNEPSERLISSYRHMGGHAGTAGTAIEIVFPKVVLLLDVDTSGDSACRAHVDERACSIQPVITGGPGATVRWRYHMGLSHGKEAEGRGGIR